MVVLLLPRGMGTAPATPADRALERGGVGVRGGSGEWGVRGGSEVERVEERGRESG